MIALTGLLTLGALQFIQHFFHNACSAGIRGEFNANTVIFNPIRKVRGE